MAAAYVEWVCRMVQGEAGNGVPDSCACVESGDGTSEAASAAYVARLVTQSEMLNAYGGPCTKGSRGCGDKAAVINVPSAPRNRRTTVADVGWPAGRSFRQPPHKASDSA